MFVDLKTAFDTVQREKLWRDMEKSRIEKGLIERVKVIYEETRNVVRVNEEESEEFWTGVGLRQGCPLSLTLFKIYIYIYIYIYKRSRQGRSWRWSYGRKKKILFLSIRGRRGLTCNQGGGPKKYDEDVREVFRQEKLDAERRQVQNNDIWKGNDENEESKMEMERARTRNSQEV